MLIEFTFGNFRSFSESVTLSMVAAKITSDPKSVDENNVIEVSRDLSLLTSAAIYGANASGKSNLVLALSFMRDMALNSSRKIQPDQPIPVNPFRLNPDKKIAPSTFEVYFLAQGQKYRYGFEINAEKVVNEWLYAIPTIRPAMLFERQGDQIEINPRRFREGRGLEERTRSNVLFLTVAADFNGPISRQIQAWFRSLSIIAGVNDQEFHKNTVASLMNDPVRAGQIKQLISSLDLDIAGVQVDPGMNGSPEVIRTAHYSYDSTPKFPGQELFSLESDESEGTKKLFYLTGPILECLVSGNALVIDELDARVHPLITVKVIRLFNSVQTNPRRSQLIFTTHDTNLLRRDLFRRDQIWFTEKNHFGSSHLYSLVEFKPRNDASFEKDYLLGRFGAVPYPSDVSSEIHAFVLGEEKGNYGTSPQPD
jgi:uncharacterized protein